MNKRAQFFIIAALIISGVILTAGKVYTFSRIETTDTQVYDLSNEIQYETSQVIDNGLFNEKSADNIKSDLKSLTEYYAESNPDSNINILYGNSSGISILEYDLSAGETKESKISVGDVALPSESSPETSFQIADKNLKVIIRTKDSTSDSGSEQPIVHELLIDSQQVFYIVVRKKMRDENVIIYR